MKLTLTNNWWWSLRNKNVVS